MTASQTRAQLVALLTPLVAADGYDLEDLTVTTAGRRSVVRILVDRDGGITLDDVAAVSRTISAALDTADEADADLFGPSYVLEVSSPGVDRPLTEPRHWRRNLGRLVTLTPVEGEPVTGRLTAADDTTVTVDDAVHPLAGVAQGVVQVEFNRPGVPEPADDSDDDDTDDSDDSGDEDEA